MAILLGLQTRVFALLNLLNMIGAALLVHLAKGIFMATGGWEFVGLLGMASLALVVSGPGQFSIDHAVVSRRRVRQDASQDRLTEATRSAATA